MSFSSSPIKKRKHPKQAFSHKTLVATNSEVLSEPINKTDQRRRARKELTNKRFSNLSGGKISTLIVKESGTSKETTITQEKEGEQESSL